MDSSASGALSHSSRPTATHPLNKQHVLKLLGNILHIFPFPEATNGLATSFEPASLYQSDNNSALVNPPKSTKDRTNSSPKKIIKFWNDKLGVVEDLITSAATTDFVPKLRKSTSFYLETDYKGEIVIRRNDDGSSENFDYVFDKLVDYRKDPKKVFLRSLDVLLYSFFPHFIDFDGGNDIFKEIIRDMRSTLKATRPSLLYADLISCNHLLEILELLSPPAKPWPIVRLKPFTDASPGVVPLIMDPDLEGDFNMKLDSDG